MSLTAVVLFVLIASGVLVLMQYLAVWRRSRRPNVSRAAGILAFAVAGSLASMEAFLGFNRMVQWTDWYVVTSTEYTLVLIASILAPLLLAAGASFILARTTARRPEKILRVELLSLNAFALAIWIWYFHGWRVYADVGPDYASLHWPQGAAPPLPMRFLWSGWGAIAVVLLSLIVIAPTVLYADRLD